MVTDFKNRTVHRNVLPMPSGQKRWTTATRCIKIDPSTSIYPQNAVASQNHLRHFTPI